MRTEKEKADLDKSEHDPFAAFDEAEVIEFQEPSDPDIASVKVLPGTVWNIRQFGLPSEHDGEERISYYFYPCWRSQLKPLIYFFFGSVFAVWGSHSEWLSMTVIPGKLFDIGSVRVMLHLPLLGLIPGMVLGKILYNMYNTRFIIDGEGIEGQIGLVSLEQLRQPRLRFEDIRGVETDQSLLERIIGIGRVLVGSAMTSDVEIVMDGMANPRAIATLINKERSRRSKLYRAGGTALPITGE